MNNNEIKKKYNDKIKEIKLHNKLYFDKNNPNKCLSAFKLNNFSGLIFLTSVFFIK